jgi:hypothetical protein
MLIMERVVGLISVAVAMMLWLASTSASDIGIFAAAGAGGFFGVLVYDAIRRSKR